MHEIKGKQKREGTRRPCLRLKEPSSKEIHKGEHEDAKHRAHDPPAKGIHAKYTDAKADKELAKGRMGPLIVPQPLSHLIGGPGMIDFVKISALTEGNDVLVLLLLVKELRII